MILGVDLSLTRTGLAIYRGDPAAPDLELRSVDGSKLRGMQRVSMICKEIWSLTTLDRSCLIVIEGYAYAAQGDAVTGLAELRGVLLYSLWCWSASVVTVSPASLKKYVSGKGNAGKDEMLLGAQRRYGDLVTITNNDTADALGLVAMAADQYGHPLAPVPAANRAALTGPAKSPLQWPTTFAIGGDRALTTTGGLL